MKKTYILEELDCANCAAKLERKLSKITDVDYVAVTYITEKLTLEAADDKFDKVLEEAVALTKKIEHDWEIVVE